MTTIRTEEYLPHTYRISIFLEEPELLEADVQEMEVLRNDPSVSRFLFTLSKIAARIEAKTKEKKNGDSV